MEQWVRGEYAYLAKRKNRLFLNVLINDINSTYKESHISHNWILSYVLIDGIEVDIKHSHFNNTDDIILTEEQKKLVIEYALEISKKYYK